MSDSPKPIPPFSDEEPTEFAVKVSVELQPNDKVALHLSDFPSGAACAVICSVIHTNGKSPSATVDSVNWNTEPTEIERTFAGMILARVIPECLRVLFQQNAAPLLNQNFTSPTALLSAASKN